jgi:hypothetical protein
MVAGERIILQWRKNESTSRRNASIFASGHRSADKADYHPGNEIASRSANIFRGAAFVRHNSTAKSGTQSKTMIVFNHLALVSPHFLRPENAAPGAAQ